MRIDVAALMGGTVLAGTASGKKMLSAVVSALPTAHSASVLFLDFGGVALASASFLRESVLPLKAFARTTKSFWYPVVANMNEETLEELQVICDARADVMFACALNTDMSVICPKIVGRLDEKQAHALVAVRELGEITARKLMEISSEDSPTPSSPTAWNNRLSILHEKGLVIELADGRQKRYSPVLR